MGNQQSNAGAAKFFAGVTDAIVQPINKVIGPVIPSATAAVNASNDPNINPNAGKATAAMATAEAVVAPGNSKLFSGLIQGAGRDPNKPPPNMLCRMVAGQSTPTKNGETGEWYCGSGNDADRNMGMRWQQGLRNSTVGKVAANAGVVGNNPTPGPTGEWTGGGYLLNNPPGTDYTMNRGPQPNWSSRPGDGVTPPGSRPAQMPTGQAPMSDDPQQLNPQFNLSGSMDPGNKTVLGGDANSLSVHQGFPNLNASPALPQAGATPAMDTTTLLLIGGVVVAGAVLLAKKK